MRNPTQEEEKYLISTYQQWHAKYKPANLADTPQNANLIGDVMVVRLVAGAPLSPEKVRDIVDQLTRLGESNGVRGRLEFLAPQGSAPLLSNTNNEVPWASEPMLKNVTSLSAVAAMTAAQVKVFATSDARHEYDKHGNKIVSLNQKFNQRIQWLQAHPDVDPSAVAEVIERVLGTTPSEKPQDSQEGGVRCLTSDGREKAIRDRILQESRNNRTFFTPYAQKKFDKLNAELDELVKNSEKRVFRDRSKGGGGEILRGWAAVEALMEQAFRDYEGPWH